MGVLHDPDLERLLTRLHAESDEQTDAIRDHYDERDRAVDPSPDAQTAFSKAFLSDKLYALDRDKAEFCYQLCRATDARRIVEIGTSYGVSTLYLAAAVRDNVRAADGDGVVNRDGFGLFNGDAGQHQFAGLSQNQQRVAVELGADLKDRDPAIPTGHRRQLRAWRPDRNVDGTPTQFLETQSKTNLFRIGRELVMMKNDF